MVETIESPYKGVTRNKSGNGFRENASITKKNPTRRVQANAKAETALLCAKHLNFRCREKDIPLPNPEIGFEDPALTKKGRRPRKRVLSDVKIETDNQKCVVLERLKLDQNINQRRYKMHVLTINLK